MFNETPSGSQSTPKLPFPILGEIPPRAKSPRLNLVGDGVGGTNGYEVGLVCKLDLTAATATPLAAAPVAGDILGILLDRVEDLAATVSSTQQFNLVYRDVNIAKQGLVLRTGADLELVAIHFRDELNCGINN